MKYTYDGKIHKGKFINRPNRFIAEVEVDGIVLSCHLKNTGRMKELLTKDATCYIMEAKNPNRKTKYDFLSVVYQNQIVNLDSQIPNKVVADAFLNSEIKGWENPDSLKREVTIGSSRLDMKVEKDGKSLYVEVKGVDLILEQGHALFPDAPTLRGTKHLKELISLVEEGHQAMVIFLLHRDDAIDFMPNYKMDPLFFQTFYTALEKGVQARAYLTTIGENSIEFSKEIKILSRQEAEERIDDRK